MAFNIKARLAMLDRKQCELIPELNKRGINVRDPGELSKAIKGMTQHPKAQKILSAANEIVSEWEQEQARI